LNFAQEDAPFLNTFHQFALAPEDEVATIAGAAIAAGAKTAIAFVPSNPYYYEIRDSFQAAFEQAGGELLAWYGYEPALLDFSVPVATLLNVTRSRERHRRLAANLTTTVQFEARRRDDVDMIFVLADARAARLLAAQLGFFGASDIPTYAIAQVFDAARSARDTELNGLIFADVPALIAPDDDAANVRAELEAYWPQRDANLLRFYGMGFDAYRLVGPLFTEDQAAWPMRGLSGDLSLDARGRVRRVLPLAQFRNGRPVAYEVVPQRSESGGLIGQR
jgi:hypothetical protein